MCEERVIPFVDRIRMEDTLWYFLAWANDTAGISASICVLTSHFIAIRLNEWVDAEFTQDCVKIKFVEEVLELPVAFQPDIVICYGHLSVDEHLWADAHNITKVELIHV